MQCFYHIVIAGFFAPAYFVMFCVFVYSLVRSTKSFSFRSMISNSSYQQKTQFFGSLLCITYSVSELFFLLTYMGSVSGPLGYGIVDIFFFLSDVFGLAWPISICSSLCKSCLEMCSVLAPNSPTFRVGHVMVSIIPWGFGLFVLNNFWPLMVCGVTNSRHWFGYVHLDMALIIGMVVVVMLTFTEWIVHQVVGVAASLSSMQVQVHVNVAPTAATAKLAFSPPSASPPLAPPAPAAATTNHAHISPEVSATVTTADSLSASKYSVSSHHQQQQQQQQQLPAASGTCSSCPSSASSSSYTSCTLSCPKATGDTLSNIRRFRFMARFIVLAGTLLCVLEFYVFGSYMSNSYDYYGVCYPEVDFAGDCNPAFEHNDSLFMCAGTLLICLICAVITLPLRNNSGSADCSSNHTVAGNNNNNNAFTSDSLKVVTVGGGAGAGHDTGRNVSINKLSAH